MPGNMNSLLLFGAGASLAQMTASMFRRWGRTCLTHWWGSALQRGDNANRSG